MATSEVSSSETKKRMALIQVLLQGQKYAKQLQILLDKPVVQEDGIAGVDGFVEKILTSFSESIDRINDQTTDQNRYSRKRTYDHQPYSCGDGGMGEISSKCKKRSSTNLTQDKRGCYNRRISSEAQTKVSPTLEDGQAWRKYGQKVILNSKFPRSYFRCTHKYDQGCKATKQVQIKEDNPLLYQTTYIGFHTCRDTLKGPTLFALSETDPPNQYDNVVSRHRLADFSLSSDEEAVAVKEEEHKEQDTKSDLTDSINSFPRLDIMDLELSKSVSQMYNCFGALDDVTSQFDHGNFQAGHFFFGGDDEGDFTPNL